MLVAAYAAWRPYNVADVQAHVPHSPGVYMIRVLLRGGGQRVIYVGQASDLQDRLLDHLSPSEENACLRDHVAKHELEHTWVVLTSAAARGEEESTKITEHNPECNTQHP